MSSHEQIAGYRETPASGVEVPHGDPVALSGQVHGDHLHLPSPTAWPLITAFGFTLLVGGILTHYVISIAGGILVVMGCVGWFRDVLPHELHESIEIKVQEVQIASSRKSVARISVSDEHRTELGAQGFSVVAGLKGGIFGGIAMVIPALAYGLIAQHSIWYPINLLGGAGVASWQNPSPADLRAFHPEALGIALVIHAIACSLIGLVYGAILPIVPRRPTLFGGILAPVLWTGLLYASLPVINPELSQHINWWAFLISQLTFGLVAGWVVSHDEHFRRAQSMPLALRLGLEGGGLGNHGKGDRH